MAGLTNVQIEFGVSYNLDAISTPNVVKATEAHGILTGNIVEIQLPEVQPKPRTLDQRYITYNENSGFTLGPATIILDTWEAQIVAFANRSDLGANKDRPYFKISIGLRGETGKRTKREAHYIEGTYRYTLNALQRTSGGGMNVIIDPVIFGSWELGEASSGSDLAVGTGGPQIKASLDYYDAINQKWWSGGVDQSRNVAAELGLERETTSSNGSG